EQLQHAGLDADDVRLEGGFFAPVADVVLHVLLGAGDDLLDAGRVDATVADQFTERQLGDLAPERIEAGQQHGLGRVVDDQVNAGQALEGADVAAFAA